MATPLSSFITQFREVLAITLRDRDIFCRYSVMPYSFRIAKFHKPCLVSSKKYPLSQASVKCQQTLIYVVIFWDDLTGGLAGIDIYGIGVIGTKKCIGEKQAITQHQNDKKAWQSIIAYEKPHLTQKTFVLINTFHFLYKIWIITHFNNFTWLIPNKKASFTTGFFFSSVFNG